MIAAARDLLVRRRWVRTRRAATVTKLARRAEAAERMAEAAHLDLAAEQEDHRVTKAALARCRSDLAHQLDQAVRR